MIPLRDVIPSRTFPFVTIAIILVNAAVFWHQVTMPADDLQAFVRTWGVVPADLAPVSIVTSMFLHGGWLHFLANMWFLWIFGDNVEDRTGHLRFVPFYLLCGGLAALAQVVAAPASTVPMVGASGAIAGVMGAYIVLFPHSRVLALVPILFFVHLVEIRAVYFLGFWFLLQLLSGMGSLGATTAEDAGGIAFWAHAGGFAVGALAIFFFRQRGRMKWD